MHDIHIQGSMPDLPGKQAIAAVPLLPTTTISSMSEHLVSVIADAAIDCAGPAVIADWSRASLFASAQVHLQTITMSVCTSR